jgi:uncharacterized sporulation protein YeaH/YhbH (DUF444 family)
LGSGLSRRQKTATHASPTRPSGIPGGVATEFREPPEWKNSSIGCSQQFGQSAQRRIAKKTPELRRHLRLYDLDKIERMELDEEELQELGLNEEREGED